MAKSRGLVFLLLIVAGLAYLLLRKPSANDPAGGDGLNRNPAQLTYTKHALCRMDCRRIDKSEVQEILREGAINPQKSEPNGRPDPKYAVEGRTHDGQRVRIVFAEPSPGNLVVVTVIDLDTDWTCNCK